MDKAKELIASGRLLHITGSEGLLKQLPKGNWIGGTSEYFLDAYDETISDEVLGVNALDFDEFKVSVYGTGNISSIAKDAYPNGFSIVIMPCDSEIHNQYAKNAPEYEDLFIKNIIGWVSGTNLAKKGQIPLTFNGLTGEFFTDKAVVLHVSVPEDKNIMVETINIFTPDESSPVIEFKEDGFSAETCYINGEEHNFADYVIQNNINTKLPIIGDYSGSGINISFKSVDANVVNFFAPVFKGIEYRVANKIDNYAEEFKAKITAHEGADPVFVCNCILNFLHSGLENCDLGAFYGPISFGEVAYQLVNQTIVYLQVK